MAATWSPELAERLVEGLPLAVIAQAGLGAGRGRLVVLARSERRRTAALAAVFMPGARAATVAVRRRLPVRRGTRSLYVLDPTGRDRFVVAQGLVGQLIASCGLWPLLLPLVGPRAPARPCPDAATVGPELDAFCEVVDAMLTGIGADVDVTLEVTAASVDSAVGALGRIGRAAASFVRSVPNVGGSPGRVYEPGDDEEEAEGFDAVGGQEAAKAELEAICLAVREPEAFRAWGARPPRGLLLFGPPGTGKTMLARALARESGAHFIHVRATDVVSKWYGEAERRLQEAFDWARRERPAVLFFDEIDAIARDRQWSHEATHRIVSTLLENMDGLRGLQGVVVVAATNRPEAVDEALTRPGRFDRLVEVPLPGPDGRRAIFEVHLSRASRQAGRELFEPFGEEQWKQLITATDGYSGADIAEAVRRALEARVRSGDRVGRISPTELAGAAASVGRPW